MSLYGGFSTEGTGVTCVLRDFHLLDLFPKGSTISLHSPSAPHSPSSLSMFDGEAVEPAWLLEKHT